MQFLRQLLARMRDWRASRRTAPMPAADFLPLVTLHSAIHREVTSAGVRVFSLCGCCGARLEASATLCEECAQRRSRT